MPRARLKIMLPEDVWIGSISRDFPSVRFRILAALPDDNAGTGLAELAGDDVLRVVERIADSAEVVEVDLLQQSKSRVLLQFETTEPLLLFPAQKSGVPLEMPFIIQDGEAVWEVTAPQDRLSTLGEQLDAFGIQFRVEKLLQDINPEQLLTDRQERLIRAAIKYGYYDTPRSCTLTELAEELEIAKSTCSETLHRAEGKVIKQFVSENLDPLSIENQISA